MTENYRKIILRLSVNRVPVIIHNNDDDESSSSLL